MSGNPPLFEWDEDKAELNESRHGVTFAEASTAVLDPLALTRADPAHSRDEVRYIDLGVSVAGRVLVVVYTMREAVVRIISARLASNAERRVYEQRT
jgi:uncharacterized DUF497 family protein